MVGFEDDDEVGGGMAASFHLVGAQGSRSRAMAVAVVGVSLDGGTV
jgi:hypothetical protein